MARLAAQGSRDLLFVCALKDLRMSASLGPLFQTEDKPIFAPASSDDPCFSELRKKPPRGATERSDIIDEACPRGYRCRDQCDQWLFGKFPELSCPIMECVSGFVCTRLPSYKIGAGGLQSSKVPAAHHYA